MQVCSECNAWVIMGELMAGHHIMFDQPLALVATIRSTLAEWKRSTLVTASGVTIPRLEARAVQSCYDIEEPVGTWMDVTDFHKLIPKTVSNASLSKASEQELRLIAAAVAKSKL